MLWQTAFKCALRKHAAVQTKQKHTAEICMLKMYKTMAMLLPKNMHEDCKLNYAHGLGITIQPKVLTNGLNFNVPAEAQQ